MATSLTQSLDRMSQELLTLNFLTTGFPPISEGWWIKHSLSAWFLPRCKAFPQNMPLKHLKALLSVFGTNLTLSLAPLWFWKTWTISKSPNPFRAVIKWFSQSSIRMLETNHWMWLVSLALASGICSSTNSTKSSPFCQGMLTAMEWSDWGI